MSSLPLRAALASLLLAASPGLARGQTATPPAAAPAESQDTTEAKLAVVLRSYTLLQQENDQLRAAQEKLLADKGSLEAQLSVAKDALPLADQATALHEQLRQTQDQLAALSLENNELKTRLSLNGPGQAAAASSHLTPVTVATPAPEPVPAAAPAPGPRTHVIVAGDTLTKLSKQYYGTADRWTEILAANRDVLRDEKSLAVGRTLRIP